jgi:hypothetical protein
MNRAKHPVIELEFEIEEETYEIKESFPMPVIPNTFPMQEKRKEYRTDITLRIFPKNTGSVYAQYINYFVHLPDDIVNDDSLGHLKKPAPGLVEFYGENTYRDVVDFKSSPMGGGYPKYGPSRFDPVLPGLRGRSEKLRLSNNPNLDEREITWKVYADNARPLVGSKKLNEITVIEKKEE